MAAAFAEIEGGAVSRGAKAQRAAARAPAKVVPLSVLLGGPALAGAGMRATGLKRVMHELGLVARADPAVWLSGGEGVHIFPAEADATRWRALLEAPATSPFAGGVFALVVTVPSTYPAQPPTIVFETPVYHCNVSDAGSICLDLLQDKWTDTFTIPMALEAVRLLLAHPIPEDAMRQWIAELTIASIKSGGADARYTDAAAQATRRDASRSVEDFRALWGV